MAARARAAGGGALVYGARAARARRRSPVRALARRARAPRTPARCAPALRTHVTSSAFSAAPAGAEACARRAPPRRARVVVGCRRLRNFAAARTGGPARANRGLRRCCCRCGPARRRTPAAQPHGPPLLRARGAARRRARAARDGVVHGALRAFSDPRAAVFAAVLPHLLVAPRSAATARAGGRGGAVAGGGRAACVVSRARAARGRAHILTARFCRRPRARAPPPPLSPPAQPPPAS